MSNEMNDEEFRTLLKASLVSEDILKVNDAEVDEILSEQIECPPEAVIGIRAKFVQKVFVELHPELIRSIEGDFTFGQWIKADRERAGLYCKDIAIALNKDPIFIERLETGESLPWSQRPSEITELLFLFRIDCGAFEQLLENTLRHARTLEGQDMRPNQESASPSSNYIIAELGPSASPKEDSPDIQLRKKITDPFELWLYDVKLFLTRLKLRYGMK